jgi:hypothetical protein
MKSFIITNNPMVASKAENAVFLEGTALDVFIKVRDALHLGSRLLTHPLAGNLPAQDIIYRSVAIVENEAPIDFQSVQLIETAIEKIRAESRISPDKLELSLLSDLQLIDYELVKTHVKGGVY